MLGLKVRPGKSDGLLRRRGSMSPVPGDPGGLPPWVAISQIQNIAYEFALVLNQHWGHRAIVDVLRAPIRHEVRIYVRCPECDWKQMISLNETEAQEPHLLVRYIANEIRNAWEGRVCGAPCITWGDLYCLLTGRSRK